MLEPTPLIWTLLHLSRLRHIGCLILGLQYHPLSSALQFLVKQHFSCLCLDHCFHLPIEAAQV